MLDLTTQTQENQEPTNVSRQEPVGCGLGGVIYKWKQLGQWLAEGKNDLGKMAKGKSEQTKPTSNNYKK